MKKNLESHNWTIKIDDLDDFEAVELDDFELSQIRGGCTDIYPGAGAASIANTNDIASAYQSSIAQQQELLALQLGYQQALAPIEAGKSLGERDERATQANNQNISS